MNTKGNLPLVEHFDFEKDFMEDNIRCIPMIVRFKLDACGIKLKLKEWSKLNQKERENLATFPTDDINELNHYRHYLEQIITRNSAEKLTLLLLDEQNLSWKETNQLPLQLLAKVKELNHDITLDQWRSLSTLQRYALVKLSRPSHENKNLPKALKEFGLI